jgi:hypothetical protein
VRAWYGPDAKTEKAIAQAEEEMNLMKAVVHDDDDS